MDGKTVSHKPRKKSHPHKHKAGGEQGRDSGLMKEFLGYITRAAYQVALKTGFRGSFIYFLEEVQEALGSGIGRDQKKNYISH